MSGLVHRIARSGRRAREIVLSRMQGDRRCGTCGFVGAPIHRDTLWPGLIDAWGLPPDWARWMNEREGSRCAWCGSSLRSGQLAAAIVQTVNAATGSTAPHLAALCRDPRFHRLAIAEINSAGNLHRHLSRCPQLAYSEFGSTLPAVPSEDLMALSYADDRFHIVTTSDVLEHVPDIGRALRETHRVLRPGGAHVFSVPVVWNRPTRQRATLHDGVVTHLLPPSHHGDPHAGQPDFLVFNEFGADFADTCVGAGFELAFVRDPANPALVTFIARKPA